MPLRNVTRQLLVHDVRVVRVPAQPGQANNASSGQVCDWQQQQQQQQQQQSQVLIESGFTQAGRQVQM